jgi:signal peptidase I
MRTSLTPKQIVSAVSTLAVLALAWAFLAPTAVGGSATYVVTDGVSMQPRFHAGDLAIVRRESSYHVGEIVAYHSRMLHTIVLHRIVGISNGHYRFKGDNNGFVDSEHPVQSQLVGQLWLHVPKIGAHLGPLRRPGSVVLAALFGLLLFISNLFTQRRRRRRRARGSPGFMLPRLPHLPKHVPSAPVIALAIAVALCAVLTTATFRKPLRGPVPTPVPYAQSGAFAYTAAAAAGPAYPSGKATTGDPLFLLLVHNAQFAFSYRFASSAQHNVAGTASLVATLASTTGWRKTLVLASPHPFAGDRVTVGGSLDLHAIASLLVHLENVTQVASSYTLTLTPHVRAHGMVGGASTTVAFTPALSFSLDQSELEPVLPGATGHPSLPSTGNPLRPTASATVIASTLQRLAFSAAGQRVSVGTARILSLVALLGALCLLIGLGIGDLLGHRMHGTEADSILSRYRNLLVQVVHVRDPSTQRVVVVSDMAALGRIAERYDRMILHEKVAGQDAYFVAEDGVLYRYEAAGTRPTLVADVSSVAQAG